MSMEKLGLKPSISFHSLGTFEESAKQFPTGYGTVNETQEPTLLFALLLDDSPASFYLYHWRDGVSLVLQPVSGHGPVED